MAIERALALAAPGDLVLIAGKGHESTIEWADHAEPWDDRAAARVAPENRDLHSLALGGVHVPFCAPRAPQHHARSRRFPEAKDGPCAGEEFVVVAQVVFHFALS